MAMLRAMLCAAVAEVAITERWKRREKLSRAQRKRGTARTEVAIERVRGGQCAAGRASFITWEAHAIISSRFRHLRVPLLPFAFALTLASLPLHSCLTKITTAAASSNTTHRLGLLLVKAVTTPNNLRLHIRAGTSSLTANPNLATVSPTSLNPLHRQYTCKCCCKSRCARPVALLTYMPGAPQSTARQGRRRQLLCLPSGNVSVLLRRRALLRLLVLRLGVVRLALLARAVFMRPIPPLSHLYVSACKLGHFPTSFGCI
ncbi:hypothetical protein GY45DRAFT_1431429 [Cubamyces sp. BRFM 1775]|nr:hypothetical protein GY45DRAFT_1431429 [Cubamyces sp. BRFM 1775]